MSHKNLVPMARLTTEIGKVKCTCSVIYEQGYLKTKTEEADIIIVISIKMGGGI